jgi:hypothetical protein
VLCPGIIGIELESIESESSRAARATSIESACRARLMPSVRMLAMRSLATERSTWSNEIRMTSG